MRVPLKNEVNILENNNVRHLNKKQMAMVFMKKRSKQYQQEGYKYAVTISNQYMLERIFAFALDTCVMFLPIGLWEVVLLMLFGGLLPPSILSVLQTITFVLIAISVFLFNPMLIAKSQGQTLGKYFYNLKVVQKDHKEAKTSTLVMRELLGFSAPSFLLLVFFNIIGLFAFWGVNFLFLLVHPQHISIIDLFLGTRIVVLRDHPRTVDIMEQKAEIEQEPEMKKPSNTIDLHIHSTFSDDGEYNVEEIFQMAAKHGLKTISICDHNTVKANMIAKRMSTLYHVDFVPGIELDCRYQDVDIRVLGYFINTSSEIFAHLENESLKREKVASLQRVKLFEQETGIHINVEAMIENDRFQKITGEMIAHRVLEDPKLRSKSILQPYLQGEDKQIAYTAFAQDFFGIDGPCYVAVRQPKFEDIIDVIKLTGGVPVLAYAGKTLEENEAVFMDVLTKGIEGIEVFTPYHTKPTMARLLKIAKEYKLFITSGSDFHGLAKPYLKFGETNCPLEAEKIIHEFIASH